jgi:hypothetical protein
MNASGCRNQRKHGRWPAKLLLLAGMTCAAAQSALAHWPVSPLASVDVYDRTSGTVLAVYEKDGRRYVVGTPGHEYEIRVRNRTGERILAVTSVDGVNVVSGETASPAQSGYVLDGGGSVDIAGWRRSLERTAAFYFTDLGDSYAARTGRPKDVGVIGVAGSVRPATGRRTDCRRHRAISGRCTDQRCRRAIAGRAAGGRRRGWRDGSEAVCGGAQARYRLRSRRDVLCTTRALRARERIPRRDDRDPIRPPRQPDRDGRAPAAALRAARARSVSRHAVRATSAALKRCRSWR